MNYSLIVAMTKHRQIIGDKGQMPWHLPADLAYFKATTLGKTIVMGRRTYEAIGKALPQRRNIVLSRNPAYKLKDAEVINDISALENSGDSDAEIMIIGGSQIYQQFLEMSQKLYITWVEADITGDTRFPTLDWQQWQCTQQQAHDADQTHAYNYHFNHYQRR